MFPGGLGNIMTDVIRAVPAIGTREAEALAFIERHLETLGYSPTMDEIAGALGVGGTRARQLVHRLAQRRAIERKAGAQRGISVPGLFERLVKARLRAEGVKVDEDFVRAPECGISELPLMPPFEHIDVDDWAEIDDDGSDGGDDGGADRRG